jgi:hypothetical protein
MGREAPNRINKSGRTLSFVDLRRFTSLLFMKRHKFRRTEQVILFGLEPDDNIKQHSINPGQTSAQKRRSLRGTKF